MIPKRALFSCLMMFSCLTPLQAEEVKPLDAALTGFRYPFAQKERVFESQGKKLKMVYMDVSPEKEANGKSVLLLHGKNFSGAYWESTMKALLADGFRVIAPDQIGFGKSDKPVDYQYSIHAMAAQTKGLLDELGVEKAAVVGHSMGGMVATRFALMFTDSTESLTLINPIGLEDWKRMVPYATVDAMEAAELKKKAAAVKDYMTKAYFDGKWKDDYAPLIELQAGWVAGEDWPALARVSALTAEMIFTQPVMYEFSDLKVPVLLIVGDRDRTAIGKERAAPEVAGKMGLYQNLGPDTAAAIPGAKLVMLPGLGHLPQFEDFDAVYKPLAGFLGAK